MARQDESIFSWKEDVARQDESIFSWKEDVTRIVSINNEDIEYDCSDGLIKHVQFGQRQALLGIARLETPVSARESITL